MIPKIIYQCGSWKENDIPDYVRTYSETWKNFSPDWDYKYFDDEMCIDNIGRLAGDDMVSIYKAISRGDNRADLWRCIHIVNNGGFYADLDSKLFGNINDIYDDTKQFVAFRNSYLELGEIWENWFFGANKNNIVLVDIIKKIQHKIRLSNKSVDWQETFLPFSNIVNQFKNKEWFFDISNSAHQIVGHIAAHDNWHNKDYFNNGGPTSV